MTRRRIIEPGTVWALSRRTTRRHYLFHPDEAGQMKHAYWYALAFAANKHGVLVHTACLMSTHSHEVVTDVRGELPRFLQTFHRLVALFTKAYRGWPEEVFSKQSTSAQRLLNVEAMVHAMAYAIANPVQALAVREVTDWPGALTLPRHIGRHTITASRPKHYYNPHKWPDELKLKITMPAEVSKECGEEVARELIAEQVKKRQWAARHDSRKRSVPFFGIRRLFKMRHTRRAHSYEIFGTTNPEFTAHGSRIAARTAVYRRHQFNRLYDEALRRWSSGERDVVFPYGTWWMCVHHGAQCQPPP